MLNLPIDTSVAALALTATFYASHDAREAMETLEEGGTLERARATPELVVTAAVYLACKLEESIVRLADVVNATTTALGNGAAKRGYDRVVVDDRANVRCDDESMRDRREGARLAGYGEEDGAEDDDGVVVGARYYAYKEATLAMEQRLLKAMEYELNVEQPHVFMFHIVEVIKGGEALACAASAVLLDALFGRDGVVAPDDAATFAAVAVRAACVRLGCESEVKRSREDEPWWVVLGFDAARMDAIERDAFRGARG
tara:strand:+ start:1024 stop:1794 length:771 start_codon:yes stop_codon:yes gene_type:complete